jgi:hypothetical protein
MMGKMAAANAIAITGMLLLAAAPRAEFSTSSPGGGGSDDDKLLLVAPKCPKYQTNCSSPCPCAPKHPLGNNCTPYCDPRSAHDNAWSPAKPNVLLLGDSIAAVGTGYFPDVRALLGPNATVSNPRPYPQGGDFCGSSWGVASASGGCLGLALGGKKWDVIHWNWGA